MTKISPCEPPKTFLESYLSPGLMENPGFSLEKNGAQIKLDQNESPFDWPEPLKKKIATSFCNTHWHRYPSPYPEKLTQLVADYAQVPFENILLSPGSNYHITSIIHMLSSKKETRFILAKPSFPLYEMSCRYQGLPFESWNLNNELEYDTKLLPHLSPPSVVMFASPNNPVGNTLPYETLETLLKENPQTLFVADEAYYEFVDRSYLDLLEKYPHLVILRTFSKAMGAAGIRLAYTLGSGGFIKELKKLALPFIINSFTEHAFSIALTEPNFAPMIQENVQLIIKEREKLGATLSRWASDKTFKVYPSQANFFLLEETQPFYLEHLYNKLIEEKIQIRKIRLPGQKGGFRVTVGTPEENKQLVEAMKKYIE